MCVIWLVIAGLHVSAPAVSVPKAEQAVVTVLDPWMALRSMPNDYRRLLQEGGYESEG